MFENVREWDAGYQPDKRPGQGEKKVKEASCMACIGSVLGNWGGGGGGGKRYEGNQTARMVAKKSQTDIMVTPFKSERRMKKIIKRGKERKGHIGARMTIAGCGWKLLFARLRVSLPSRDNRTCERKWRFMAVRVNSIA